MKLRIVLGMCIAMLLTGPLLADSTFTGAVNELWSNPDNWSDGLPDVEDKAIMSDQLCILDYDAGEVGLVSLSGSGTDRLRLVDGAALTIAPGSNDGWIIVGYEGGLEEPHTLEVLGGVLNTDHRMKVGFQGRGLLVVDHAGVVNINGQHFSIGDDFKGDGRVEMRGGALNLNDNDLFFERGVNSTASVDFSGGQLTWDFTDAGLALINDRMADGTITAYNGVGTVVVENIEDNDPETTAGDTLVVKGLHPMTPGPEDGGTVLPGPVTLSWTLPDPCVPGQSVPVDVYFTDDLQALKSFSNPDAIRVISNQNATSKVVQVQKKTRYYWAVDTYQGTENDPVYGPIFEFYVDNIAPVVQTNLDITTWLDNDSLDVAIGGTVTDVNATTTAWTVVSEPNEGTAVIANADQTNTTVTLSALGTYVLQLEADDGEYQGQDTMTINVYANSCLAAQSLPGYDPLPGDLNLDCVVDQADVDLLLEQWLNCNGLDCPDIDPVDPNLL